MPSFVDSSFVNYPVIGVDVRSAIDPDTLSPYLRINSDDLRTVTTPICSATTGTTEAAEIRGTTIHSFIRDELIEPYREFFANNNIELRADSKIVEESYDNPYENTEEWLSLLEEK